MTAPLILGTNSIKDEGYEVANSVRLDSTSTAYLSRTVNLTQGTTSQHKFTISCWFKLGKTGQTNGEIFGAHGSNDYFAVRVQNGNKIDIISYDNATKGRLTTTQLLRDHSAWYHIVVACDSNNASGTNRMRLYLNGSEVTDFSTDTNPSSGADIIAENMDEFNIGRNIDQVGGAGLFDGYITEFVYIDNDQLEPSYFGEFDEDTGIWKPKDLSELSQLSNTFSFYLDFEDSSNLGNDVSGNNLDFTSNNLTSIDQTTDTPTNNYCTLNPLYPVTTFSYSDGNCKGTSSSSYKGTARGTIGIQDSGKWFFEVKITSSDGSGVGISAEDMDANTWQPSSGTFVIYLNSGNKVVNGTSTSYGATYGDGDIIGVAYNSDDAEITFYKNGVSQGTITGLTTGKVMFPSISDTSTSGDAIFECNFGNPTFTISSGNSDGNGFGNFEYAPPTNYFSLCSSNLAEYG